MNARKFSQRERLLALMAIVSAAGFIVSQVIFGVVRNSWTAMEQEEQSLTERIRKVQILLSRQNRMENQMQEAQQLLGESIDMQELMTHWLGRVNAIAQTKKIRMQEINPLPVEKEDDLRTIKLKVTVTGSWSSMMEFLAEVQQDPNRFDIQEIILEKTGDDDLRCQMTLTRWSLLARTA